MHVRGDWLVVCVVMQGSYVLGSWLGMLPGETLGEGGGKGGACVHFRGDGAVVVVVVLCCDARQLRAGELARHAAR